MISESDTDNVLQSIYTAVMSHIQISLRKSLDWIIDQSLIIILVFENIIP